MSIFKAGLSLKQKKVIHTVKKRWGGRVDTKMDGDMAWVSFRNNARHWSSGYIHGLIGPGGEAVLYLNRMGEDTLLEIPVLMPVTLGSAKEKPAAASLTS